MLDLERTRDPQAVLRLVLESWQGKIWTAMPGIVESYNADLQTCAVNVAIKGKLRALDALGARTGPYEDVVIPKLVDCPVIFMNGGGFALTFPVASGDECLVLFAARCIDGWWSSGAISSQAEMRMHDLSDGFALIGPFSKARSLADVSADAVQLRNTAGDVFVEVGPDGVRVKGGLFVEGDVEATGSQSITGDIEITGTLTVNGVDVGETHTHSGVTTGGGVSGPVVP